MKIPGLYKMLTHPFFIGLILSVIVWVLWNPAVSKYRVETSGYERMDPTRKLYYFDLDGDGSSEEIAVDDHPPLLKIMLISRNRIAGQYNLRSQPLSQDFINAGDYNRDGLKELYVFTVRRDSLLLSIFAPFADEPVIQLERPFFFNDTITFEADIPLVHFLGFMEQDSGANRPFFFAVNTGFSTRPRGFFKYNIERDALIESPLSAASVHHPVFMELLEDSSSNIILSTTAPANLSYEFPYRDHSVWLMMLDEKLEFAFKPVEFPESPASLQVLPLKVNERNGLVAFYHQFGKDTIQSSLILFDSNGKLLKSRPVVPQDRYNDYLMVDHSGTNPAIGLMDARHRTITRFNPDLEETGREEVPALLNAKLIKDGDLDGDGNTEYMFLGEKSGTMVAFREGLTDPVMIDMEQDQYPQHISQVIREGTSLFYMQFSGYGYMLKYKRNPFHVLTYPTLIGIYLGISLLVLLVFRLQKYRAEVRFLTERKINELQIRNLKNQIDPHFTFNILNSIGSMYALETDKNKAYELFVRYSKLLRYSLKNSDKVSIPIDEELQFVRNFIELEQSRIHPEFSWEIQVEEDVDLTRPIPRMIIHSFVENAIKHGILQAQEQGSLLISVARVRNAIEISIRDNGPGPRSGNRHQRYSSGKGLKIIDELVLLFHKLEGIRIRYDLHDLSEIEPGQTGTLAVVTIPE